MSIVATIKKAVFGSYVPIILINTGITAKTAQDVRDCIARIDTDRAQAVALLINSPGGSAVQCEIITNMIKSYTKRHHLPLYTFADDIAASGGQYLLSIGDKSFVQETSLVGSVGVVSLKLGFNHIANDYKIKPEVFNSNEEQLLSYESLFSDLTPQAKERIINHLKTHHKIFIEHIEKYSKIKLPAEERESKIFNAQIISGKDAVKYGLVDEIGSYQTVLKKDFPEANIEILQQKSWKQKLLGGVFAKASIEENSLAKNLLLI